MKNFFATFLIVLLSLQSALNGVEAAVSPQISDFLCERGMSYYGHGKYPEALTEFRKALLANPESSTAREFIGMIEARKNRPDSIGGGIFLNEKSGTVNSLLDKIESRLRIQYSSAAPLPRETQFPKADSETLTVSPALNPEFQKATIARERSFPAEDAPEAVVIDMGLFQQEKGSNEINTNMGERLVMKGKNISRFLVTGPDLLKVSRQNVSELFVEPQNIGSTYVHAWDETGRKTFKFIIGPRRFKEEFLQQLQQRMEEENLPESFKFGYSINQDSFYTGRGFGDAGRQSQSYGYTASSIGETPIGNFDYAIGGTRSSLGTYSISNMRMGITNGHYDQFKDINMRFLDFSSDFTAFGFPITDLRGVKLEAPMFKRRLSYMSFWGALPGGTGFTQLQSASGTSKTKQAWLEGIGLNYNLSRFANFKTFHAHSYGSERTQPVLTSDVSGFGMDYHFNHFDLDSQMAYDYLNNISFTNSGNFTFSKLRVGLSMTQNDKEFTSLLGGTPASGSIGGALNVNYRLTPEINISNSFSATRDKVFGNPDRPGRPNFGSSTSLSWVLDPHTDLGLGYSLGDQMGSNSPSVIETKHFVIRKKIYFARLMSFFLDYQNSKSKNFTSPAQDFNNNRILGGVSFRLIGDLYASYHKEIDYLRNTFTNKTTLPTASEYGLNYYRSLSNSLFFINARLFYRDEENTSSVLSFLSGEDRLEGQGELTYRPNPDCESFLKISVKNVWAEKEGVAKHLDLDLSWGMRFVWDTGLRWQSIGSFNGYVFYDLNGDGIKQPLERGVKGAKIDGGNGKTSITDAMGYYKLSGVVGKKAVLALDLKTIPKGYNPTTSTSREADIVPAKTKRVDFGIATRTEISGLVFHDKNGNGKYDAGEEAVKGIIIILDAKEKAVTSPMGEYMFRKIEPGEHVLKLDLASVPVKFIPKVSIVKTIKVLEGATLVYTIPLSEQK